MIVSAKSGNEQLHGTMSTSMFPNNINGLMRTAGPRKTLIFFPSGIGNYLMLTPALKTLSKAIDVENLHVLALSKVIGSIAEESGIFDTVHVWEPNKQSKLSFLALAAKLRAEKFTYSISMFPSISGLVSLLTFLIHARTRIGFHYPNKPLFTAIQTVTVPINENAHDTDQNSDLIDALLGIQEPGTARELTFPFSADREVLDDLQEQRYFVCHPGSSTEHGMKEKRLPPPAIASVISKINSRYGLKCVLIGGPEEENLRIEIAELAPQAVLSYPSKNFKQLAAIIEGSQFYLGNDSGLMHTATAIGKSCISFFGPTDDKRTGPYDEKLRLGKTRHLVVRNPDVTCSPCWTIKTITNNPPCIYGDTRCLRQLDVNKIWPEIDKYIENLSRTSGRFGNVIPVPQPE